MLLHLIDKNKVDIYDIPIVEITQQYLDYIRQMETEDMNVMSEFLVMAATLVDIKCRMLLPKEVNEDGEEEDPRAELVQKLLEYKMFKYMSYELRDRLVDAFHPLCHCLAVGIGVGIHAYAVYACRLYPPDGVLYKILYYMRVALVKVGH